MNLLIGKKLKNLHFIIKIYKFPLFNKHDLPVARQIRDRIVVLKNRRVCEINETEKLFNNPSRHYTNKLPDLLPVIKSII